MIAPSKRSSLTHSCITYDEEEDIQEFHLLLDLAEVIAEGIELKVHGILAKSQFVKLNSKVKKLPHFSLSELVIGERLGRGGFSNIHAIDSINVDARKGLLDDNENKNIGIDQPYVVKRLNPRLISNLEKLLPSIRDLAKEAHFLSALSHKHIIQLRGCSAGGLSGLTTSRRVEGYFLVLDRLEISLSMQIQVWKKEKANDLRKVRHCNLTRTFYEKRLSTARDIADAVSYLHERNIVHMDLKCANIGFDRTGCVKLFDFGLANELPYSDNPDQVFHVKNVTGTPRYMAPEIILKEPINSKVDVYSFSIILWEMMALEKVFEDLNGDEVKFVVRVFDKRPEVSYLWPKKVRKLLRMSWRRRSIKRPFMREVHATLERILVEGSQAKPERRFFMFRRDNLQKGVHITNKQL